VIRRNRNWVILHQFTESNVWMQVTAISAPTRRAAVAEARKGVANPYQSGRFRAIKASEWGAPIIVVDPPRPAGLPEDYWEAAQ